ncbi:hypothetical protein GE107_24720 [Cohnella sp. CFH 77786]|uniref:PIG-L deacetylase family protein n=1 Tax=Cohnella sp. CFH 77786 TaxID=2662265 RepID=UPI001C60D3F3|nr:PIG-L family deacetylase [Cohnella sp. CFH 77786]MBW5449233.1 hypothetical protein [Cohnella sp. CFH 77786]
MNRRYLFVSPHLDDAVISCGDYIDALVRSGSRVTVATVFTGAGTELSLLARIIHKKIGLGLNAMDSRREEDRLACKRLGADWLHLDLLECIYRKNNEGNPVYNKLTDIFRTDYHAEHEVIQEVTAVLNRRVNPNAYEKIFVPLAIGRHVDHGIVRHAVEKHVEALDARGISSLIYYEDLPYLCFRNDPGWETDLAQDLHSTHITLPRSCLKMKIAAILQYPSQIGLLWNSKISMMKQMMRHSRSFHPSRLGLDRQHYAFRLHAAGAPDAVPLVTLAPSSGLQE